ncbi:hypothetical protein [uncultured Alsobacter sp.]|uniref:hypothetical protein n=1 Tax=uncultured Alsobacter sp. TaxID=1748258 RepID=UPI0025F6C8EF|nr:hypothetical protein [uncultured Alsobacter sp.]
MTIFVEGKDPLGPVPPGVHAPRIVDAVPLTEGDMEAQAETKQAAIGGLFLVPILLALASIVIQRLWARRWTAGDRK